MNFHPNQLELLPQVLKDPTLQVFLNPDWGSQNPNHRDLIHQFIKQKIDGQTSPLKSSISHTHGMGAVVFSHHPVGVDIEIIERVKPVIAARVSTTEEVESSPSPSALWTAKESAFKASKHFKQPSVISKITIGSWKNVTSQVDTFEILNPEDILISYSNGGVTLQNSHYCLGIFLIRS